MHNSTPVVVMPMIFACATSQKVVMASQVKSACCQVQQTCHANVEVQHAVYVMCREYVWLYPKTSIHDTAGHQQYIAAHLMLYGATIWMLDATYSNNASIKHHGMACRA